MLMTWQLWFLYVVPLLLALFWVSFTGYFLDDDDDL